MSKDLATLLHAAGRAHALASIQLYKRSIDYANEQEIEDAEKFAFNGTFSLSVHYLLGLGLELMLKSAVAAFDEDVDAKYLQNHIRHDLVCALDEAERRGFTAPSLELRELLEHLRDPYKKHWFKYERPEQMLLPDDFNQVQTILSGLDDALDIKLKG